MLQKCTKPHLKNFISNQIIPLSLTAQGDDLLVGLQVHLFTRTGREGHTCSKHRFGIGTDFLLHLSPDQCLE